MNPQDDLEKRLEELGLLKDLFPLGLIQLSPAFQLALASRYRNPGQALGYFTQRHATGDWEGAQAIENRAALENGERVESTFYMHLTPSEEAAGVEHGPKFFIITEADFSETTVVLAEE